MEIHPSKPSDLQVFVMMMFAGLVGGATAVLMYVADTGLPGALIAGSVAPGIAFVWIPKMIKQPPEG